jgi:hypothetical protein
LIKGNITSDGIIDDDFESELAGHEPTVSSSGCLFFALDRFRSFKELHDTEDVDYHLMAKIAEYGIVECCGDDKFGRKTIVCSACRLPNEDAIKNSDFKTVDKFYDCLLK